MSLKKIVGLLAGFALAVGLIGAGVGAVFTDSVTAKQNINVGTFSCVISDGGGGVISDGGHTVTYSDFTIMSSAPGSDPFHFTVKNTGSIADVLTVTPSGLGDPAFSVIGDPFAPVSLASGDTHLYNTGVQWTVLSNANLGEKGSVTLTVNCGEQAAAAAGTVIFDNTTAVLPDNLPSLGYEATSTSEFGAEVQFAGTARKISTATVTMSSWACETGAETVPFPTAGTCVTTPGATYNVPITFNVYANATAAAAHGPTIATKTQIFAIPYRPSSIAGGDNLGWNAADSHGFASNITFTFSGEALPATAIFGISFNTDDYGYTPLHGTGSPVDSLNVGLRDPASVGTFLPDASSAWLNSSWSGAYTSVGATGAFRLDNGGWVNYMPAVQITASN